MKIRAQKKNVLIPAKLLRKYNRLKRILKSFDSVLVALSGGVDSSLLLRASVEALDGRVMAVVINSPLFFPEEIKMALKIARKLKVKYELINSDHYLKEKFRKNTPARCYFCKLSLFKKLEKIRRAEGIAMVVEGSNLDDELDYRPGKKALRELKIRSPLKEAGLKKAEIRLLAKVLGLSNWNSPANACLATRIPYYQPIEPKNLEKIREAELYLKKLGLAQVRVRDHGEIARIEVWPEAFKYLVQSGVRKKICRQLKRLGWKYVTFDLEGYRTGSLNPVKVSF